MAETLPSVSVRYGHELLSFSQDASGVTATVKDLAGKTSEIKAAYLVGCDGGASIVRKTLGIKLSGNEDRMLQLRQSLHYCEELFDRIPIGKGRHYHVADNHATQMIVQDSTRHFTLHSIVDSDEDMVRMFAKTIGMPLKFDTLYVGEWKQNLLLADSYGEGRVFIAGDAAHLVIPTGGLGMNSGVGDAIDLSWKLAATLEGWGGPKLLPAYTTERRKVGDLNVQASRYATLGRRKWRSMWKPNIRDDTPEGAASRAELARVADTEQRKSNEMTGAELGYHYFGSPLVAAGGRRGAGLRLRRVHALDLAGRAAAAHLARRRHGDAGPHRLRPRLHAAAARQVAGGCFRAGGGVCDISRAVPRARHSRRGAARGLWLRSHPAAAGHACRLARQPAAG